VGGEQGRLVLLLPQKQGTREMQGVQSPDDRRHGSGRPVENGRRKTEEVDRGLDRGKILVRPRDTLVVEERLETKAIEFLRGLRPPR
jgi:hypothetical protein